MTRRGAQAFFAEAYSENRPACSIVLSHANEIADHVRVVCPGRLKINGNKDSAQIFPELDRAAWFRIEEARMKILRGQAVFLDVFLAAIVNGYVIAQNITAANRRAQTEQEQSMSLSVDWNSVFVPAIGLAEIVVRGSLMYLGLFVIMRFMARRQAGHFGPADLLVIVLIADAAQNGLGKEYSSVTEGLALVVTIVAWEYLLDWLAWRFPATRPYLKPASLTLIRDGRLIPQNLRREMITEDELKSQLREQSVESYEDIKLATLEGDGRLSVLKRN